MLDILNLIPSSRRTTSKFGRGRGGVDINYPSIFVINCFSRFKRCDFLDNGEIHDILTHDP